MGITARSDVLIVGAGPGGSALAVLLAQAGVRVTLIDRAAFPRDKPCSEYLSPEAVRLLDRFGVIQAVEARGALPLAGTTVVAPRGSRVTGEFARSAPAPSRPTGLSVPRLVLDAELVRVAVERGASLLERVTAEALLYEEGGVAGAVVRTSTGTRRTIRARVTVGADGLRSVVARQLGRRHHGVPSRLAFVAHVSGVPALGPTSEMHVTDHGYVGLNAIGSDLANVALVLPRRHAAAARGRAEAFFFEQLERYPGVRGRVSRRNLVRAVLVTGPFSAWSRRVVADGALLIGDAADFFDPFTGQGIHAALRGAELAAGALRGALEREGRVTARALGRYAAERRRVFGGKWAVERLIGYAMWAPALFDRAVRRLERRGQGHTLIGVTGDYLPPARVLNPLFLARMVF